MGPVGAHRLGKISALPGWVMYLSPVGAAQKNSRAVGELFIGPAVWSGPEGFEQVVKTNTRGTL
jgi:hypothetical protein